MTVAVMILGLGGQTHAEAQDANCSFLEIKATNQAGGVDKKLARLAKKLQKPAFAAWKSFKLVARHDTALEAGKEHEIHLELDGKLVTTLLQHTKVAGKKDRFQLDITVDTKKRKGAVSTQVKASAGDYLVYVFSSKPESGDLLALTCSAP